MPLVCLQQQITHFRSRIHGKSQADPKWVRFSLKSESYVIWSTEKVLACQSSFVLKHPYHICQSIDVQPSAMRRLHICGPELMASGF